MALSYRIAKLLLASALTTLGACLPLGTESDVNVTSGVNAANAYPEVVELTTPVGNGMAFSCTGTFVSDSVVLTAAHCFEDNLKKLTYLGSNPKMKVLKKIINPKYNPKDDTAEGAANDSAVAVFAPGTFNGRPRTIAMVPLKVGDQIEIVGFGANVVNGVIKDGQGNQYMDASGEGVKRRGTNEISRVAAGFLEYVGVSRGPGTGKDSVSAPGDSGGPIFRGEYLVGIVSRGTGNAKTSDASECDLTYENTQGSTRSWLKSLKSQGIMIPFESESSDGSSVAKNISLNLVPNAQKSSVSGMIAATPQSAWQLAICPISSTPADCVAQKKYSLARIMGQSAGRSLFDINTKSLDLKSGITLVALNASGNIVASRRSKIITP